MAFERKRPFQSREQWNQRFRSPSGPSRSDAFSNQNRSPNASPPNDLTSENLTPLVDQITDAVRKKLITRGVPLTPESSSPLPDRIGQTGETPFESRADQPSEELAKKIDHTLLKPEATREEIERICAEARKYGFATVCVNSSHVALAAKLLQGSQTKPIAVVGFPLGAADTRTKAFETREAVKDGAQEIDMVINIGALKGREYDLVLEDIREIVQSAQPHPVKVILETSTLSDEEKVIGCALAKAAGAAFVKTSTGFGSSGATAEDVALMRRIVGSQMGVKASGGIRSYEDAAKMIEAGASRIGASSSIAIVTQKSTDKNSKGY